LPHERRANRRGNFTQRDALDARKNFLRVGERDLESFVSHMTIARPEKATTARNGGCDAKNENSQRTP
jgi:hypothetical protein